MTPTQERVLTAYLGFVMATTAIPTTSLGVMSAEVIAEFEISATVFGSLLASNILASALLSPFAGRIADRIATRRSVVLVLLFSASGVALLGIAPHVSIVLCGMLVTSFGMALANPATNRVIVSHFLPGNRGWVTGVKQSGVQLSSFAAGVLLPPGEAAIGWRSSLVIASLAIAVTIPLALLLIRPNRALKRPVLAERIVVMSPTVLYVSVYAFLVGFANSARLFIPLFAREVLGASLALAGLSLGLIGLAALVGRVVWARIAERRGHYRMFLSMFGIIGAMGYGILYTSLELKNVWLLIVGAVLIGMSASSWNSVATLAILRTPFRGLGTSSATVMMGFFLGVGLGTPVYGATVDISQEYGLVWAIAAGAVMVAAVVIHRWPEPARAR